MAYNKNIISWQAMNERCADYRKTDAPSSM
jgi:hypothetical protein